MVINGDDKKIDNITNRDNFVIINWYSEREIVEKQ
jgi:hypothetical protein